MGREREWGGPKTITDLEDGGSWGYRGGEERGNDWSCPIFDGRRKTRGGGPAARY